MTVYQYVDEITGQQQDLEPTDPLDPVPSGLVLITNEDTSPYQTIPLDSYQYWDFTNKAWYYPLFSLLTLAEIQQQTDDTATTFSWNGNDYSVGSLQIFPWTEIFEEAAREDKANERSVLYPDGSTGVLTNAQIVDLFETFSNFIQATRDIYAESLIEINNTTITTLAELNSYWTSARSGYVNTRTVASDNEDLQNNKVDKVEGKGLSTNDFIDSYKGYLDRTTYTSTSVTIVTSTSAGGHVLSSTKVADVTYSIDLSCTATVGGTSSATVLLEICSTNSTTAGDWVEYGRVSTGQTITLALALQSIQASTQALVITDIPAGYYVRLRSIISGTGSASLRSSREKY